MKPQPVLYMTTQRHHGDCGVAAFAMFLVGVTYEDALIALGGEVPTILRRGVWFPELQRAAARLGFTLRLKRRYDLDEHEGILQVTYAGISDQHVLVLREGLLFDTDTSVWRPEDYFAAKRAKPGALLIRGDE